MQAKQINWFRNRKSQKRAETAIGSDGETTSASESESESRRALASIRFNQTSSIYYEYTIFTRNTRIIQAPTTTLIPPCLSLSTSPSLLFRKKEIKCGRHVATLLLIWQTDADADVDVDVDVV